MKNENMNEYALPFAAWELRLYLNTHPEDECALREYRRICNMAGGKCNYACHTTDARIAPYGTTLYESDARGMTRENGCGCGSNARGMRGAQGGSYGGGGNYGGNRCDGGNYRTARAENGGCGCGDNGDGNNGNAHHAHGGNVWSWIEGPWPWEPEANGGGC